MPSSSQPVSIFPVMNLVFLLKTGITFTKCLTNVYLLSLRDYGFTVETTGIISNVYRNVCLKRNYLTKIISQKETKE